MSLKSRWGPSDSRGSAELSVSSDAGDGVSAFAPLSEEDVRKAFSVPAVVPPILSLREAAALVKLQPQTLKRKVSEGMYARSVVRGKPLRFWRDRLVGEVMQ